MQKAVESGSGLRESILQHATLLFAEGGYAATSVRGVAQACECTKPALYYHFAHKEALYLECLGRQAELLRQLAADLRTDMPARERMLHGLGHFFTHVEAHPTGMRLLMRAELRPEATQPMFDFEAQRTHHLGRIREILADGVASGELRPDIDLEDAAFAIKGMVDQRLQLWLHGVALPADLPQRIVTIFMDGVVSR